jgi:hypothetical protein
MKLDNYSTVYLARIKANAAKADLAKASTSVVDSTKPILIDEVNEYLEARYICEQDAFWRIYGYGIHGKTPSVERLVVHLPNKNWISFSASTNLARLANCAFLKKTTLTEWFVTNANCEDGRSLTYCDFPTKFTWDATERSWHLRGGG